MSDSATGAARNERRPDRVRGPLLTAVSLAAATCLALGSPAYAHQAPAVAVASAPDPRPQPGEGVPDQGSRPPSSGLPAPGTGTPGGSSPGGASIPTLGPLATQILNESRAVEALGEQVKTAEQAKSQAHQQLEATADTLREAQRQLDAIASQTDSAARDAYQEAAAVPSPLDDLLKQLNEMSSLASRGPDSQAQRLATARAYEEAQQLTAAAQQSYDDASTAEQAARQRYDALRRQFGQRSGALTALRARNEAAVAQLNAGRDVYEASLGKRYLKEIGNAVKGYKAGPQALAAVKYALAQLGKPYVWAAEGPDTYDCSGLVWASYRSSGITLPRVADDQYRGTTPVALDHLLPGDLIFFGPIPGNSYSIHHVGMYLGNGEMIHAPNQGDVVRISQIWWSEFYGATRVVDPVKVDPTPPPSPSPTPTPSPTGSPTPTPTPTGSGSPTPTPTGSGSGSPTPSPNPTTSGSGSPSPSTGTSLSPSPSASASAATTTP